MSDEVAIVTKAKENIIFAMSELSEKQRMALSIQKHQLIHKCSFNGIACDIDRLCENCYFKIILLISAILSLFLIRPLETVLPLTTTEAKYSVVFERAQHMD